MLVAVIIVAVVMPVAVVILVTVIMLLAVVMLIAVVMVIVVHGNSGSSGNACWLQPLATVLIRDPNNPRYTLRDHREFF